MRYPVATIASLTGWVLFVLSNVAATPSYPIHVEGMYPPPPKTGVQILKPSRSEAPVQRPKPATPSFQTAGNQADIERLQNQVNQLECQLASQHYAQQPTYIGSPYGIIGIPGFFIDRVYQVQSSYGYYGNIKQYGYVFGGERVFPQPNVSLYRARMGGVRGVSIGSCSASSR